MSKSVSHFTRYASDNKAALAGMGAIATVSALFLNLNPELFGSSLQELQLLLLLFFILSLLSLTLESLFWFKENADSEFAGLIVFTLALTVWKVVEFVLDNFRTELNQYLNLIIFSSIFIVWSALRRLKEKLDSSISTGNYSAVLRSLLYGFTTFFFFYFYHLFSYLYGQFSLNQEVTIESLAYPFTSTFVWTFPIVIAVTEFSIAFFLVGKGRRLKLGIFLIVCCAVSLLAVILPVLLELTNVIARIFLN